MVHAGNDDGGGDGNGCYCYYHGGRNCTVFFICSGDGQILNFCRILDTDIWHLAHNIWPDLDFCQIRFFYTATEVQLIDRLLIFYRF